MRNFILRLCAFLAVMLCIAPMVRADDPPPTVFDALTQPVTDAGTFFATVSALAIIVTGFFLGRRWLKRVG